MSEENKVYMEKSPEELAAFFQERMRGNFTDMLGVKVVRYQKGYCLTKAEIKPEYLNPIGSVHGGYLYTVADTTAGMASIELGVKESVTTIEGGMQFLNPAIGASVLYGEARVLKAGKRIAYTEVVVKGEDETIYAKGAFTFARIVLKNVTPPVIEG